MADGIVGYSSATPAYNGYKFRVYRNSAQNTSTGAFTKVNFDTINYDTGSNFDAVTNFRFTAPVAGFYQFNARFSASGTQTRAIVALYKNGSEVSRGADISTSSANQTLGATVSDGIQLAASDYVEVYAFSSATIAIDVGSVTTYFSGFLISRA